MESLVAFFILQGLTFDVIGAILVVTSILTFRPKDTQSYLEHNAGLLVWLFKNLVKYGEVNDNTLDVQATIKNIRQASSDHFFKDELLYHGTLLNLEIENQTKEFTKNRAYSGLSFLVGGFLLQGIGVIFQL